MASGSPCVNSRWDRAAGVEAAAAMAAKINAMLMAKGKLKPLQPLPSKAPVSAPPAVADELVVAEVDINDVPIDCRNLLTTGRTQEEIAQFSGAAVSTKGLFMSGAEQCSSAGVVRPLYLQVQGRCQEDVNKAVSRIKQIISEDVQRSSGGQMPAVMPTVPVYRQPITAAAPLTPATRAAGAPVIPAHKPAPPHSGTFVHTKIFVGLDQSQPGFSVNERVEGPSGSYLQHIQSESGARVFLRGRGSGYIEQASRRESFEPLYLYISHPNAAGLEAAKKLCENLLDTVRADHARFMSAFPSTGSAPVYPTHGYSANNSYGGQSWYSYLSNGYTSSYPTYWSTGSGASGQSQLSTGATGQSQLSSGAVQYPVRQQSAFLLPEEAAAASDGGGGGSSPKQHTAEEEKTQICADVPVEDVSAVEDCRTLMPPPAAPIRKRLREETCSKALTHTAAEQQMKKLKTNEDSGSCSGLVPYGGDSSDEEEERVRGGSKSAV
ncbi:KH homology domain-containing protein 4-like [Pimephales promelas]|uniref:KH homology domain-containing protein 4-like n=1 Tax=Pimephales promelas TaxID=90988 RepID=UPI001955A74B|nr:KH homology domain-containing protein 4-like [Pimephales promelas]KAG1926164.1 KHy domain-containing protein [Pimephales promelas]